MKKKIAYVTEIGEHLATLEDNPVEHLKLLSLITVFSQKGNEYFIGKREYNFDDDTVYITCESVRKGENTIETY